MTRDQAAHTAASALEQIAISSQRTAAACIVTAVASVLVALVALGAAYQYWRAMTAMDQLSTNLERSAERMKTDMNRPTSPPPVRSSR